MFNLLHLHTHTNPFNMCAKEILDSFFFLQLTTVMQCSRNVL
uniref:Uncharacterized protein n=1 Tax=Arundo donax TaxID=35708 RepID=A0A0A9BRZ8_ARUDO